MATKKAAAKSTSIVKWDEKFATMAKKEKEQTANIGGGTGIKFGRNKIEVGGVPVKGGKLECVIIGYCAENKYYESSYDPSDISIPDCYAFADVVGDKNMKPHDQAPNKQSDDCPTCHQNQFGTAKVGRGKACGNRIRFGAVVASALEDSVATAELATGSISPTNLKGFKAYADYVNDELGRPIWSVITQIESFDDEKQQIRLEFTLVDKIDDNDALTALEKRNDKIQSILQVPFVQIEKAKTPAPTTGKSNKFAGKPSNGRGKK